MNDRQLLENLVAVSTLQLQVLLEIRALLAQQVNRAATDYEFAINDVVDHVSAQRDDVLEQLMQQLD